MASTKPNNDYIPELDMSEWRNGDEESKTKFAKKWDLAFRTSGFCTVVNHGIPDHVLDDMYSATKEFFDLDVNEKMKYVGDAFGGFHRAGMENLYAGKTSGYTDYNMNDSWRFHQSSESADMFVPSDSTKVYQPMFETTVPYWKAFRDLQKTLFEISDRALGLENGTFSHFHNDYGTPITFLRLIDYFQLSQEQLASSSTKRLGGHTDFLTYTILKCDDVPGLEIAVGDVNFDQNYLNPKFDTWVQLNPRPGAVVINAGDILRFWTNGAWKSAFHQVVPNPKRRISMSFFTGPGISARTEVRLPSAEFAGVNQFPHIKMSVGEYLKFRKDLAKANPEVKS